MLHQTQVFICLALCLGCVVAFRLHSSARATWLDARTLPLSLYRNSFSASCCSWNPNPCTRGLRILRNLFEQTVDVALFWVLAFDDRTFCGFRLKNVRATSNEIPLWRRRVCKTGLGTAASSSASGGQNGLQLVHAEDLQRGQRQSSARFKSATKSVAKISRNGVQG